MTEDGFDPSVEVPLVWARQQAPEPTEPVETVGTKRRQDQAPAHATLFCGQRDQGQTRMAEYAAQIAERLGSASGTLRQRDINALLDDAQNFARRQPGLVLGGAVLIGLVGARLVKSGSRAVAATSQGISPSTATS